MSVSIQLPASVETRLRDRFGDLNSAAKEAMLVELYRQDELTHRQLGEAMGMDRFETDALLKKHHVTEDLPTDGEYDAAIKRLGVGRGP